MFAILACLALGADPADWEKAEAVHLKNIRQVTKDFARAGEGYFSSDGKQIIFQAEEKDNGNPFYQIFVMDLKTGKVRRVSTGVGKTTCSYFRPDGKKIIFASSHLDPDAKKHYDVEYKARAEEKRTGKRRRYQWDFDPYMTIFEADPDGDVGGLCVDFRVTLVPHDETIVSVEQHEPLGNDIKGAEQPRVRRLRLAPGAFRFEPRGLGGELGTLQVSDIVVRRHPSATGDRMVLGTDEAAGTRLYQPGRNLTSLDAVEDGLRMLFGIFDQQSDLFAMPQQLDQRAARLHDIAREAVKIDVARIASDDARGRIKQTDALRDVVENGGERKPEWKQKRLKPRDEVRRRSRHSRPSAAPGGSIRSLSRECL